MASGDRHHADGALIAALAGGSTVEQAAASVRLSVRTAHRRLADPDFRERLAAVKGEALERAVAKLADRAVAAVETLAALLKADSEAVRLGAARSVLELGARLREQHDMAERLDRLEAWMAEQRGPLRRIR